MKTFTKFSWLIACMILFNACKREPLSWDNRVVAPLFKTKLGLGQIDAKY